MPSFSRPMIISLLGLSLLVLGGCAASQPSPVWQNMHYKMTTGKVGAMGPSADIGP